MCILQTRQIWKIEETNKTNEFKSIESSSKIFRVSKFIPTEKGIFIEILQFFFLGCFQDFFIKSLHPNVVKLNFV